MRRGMLLRFIRQWAVWCRLCEQSYDYLCQKWAMMALTLILYMHTTTPELTSDILTSKRLHDTKTETRKFTKKVHYITFGPKCVSPKCWILAFGFNRKTASLPCNWSSISATSNNVQWYWRSFQSCTATRTKDMSPPRPMACKNEAQAHATHRPN